MIFTATPIIQFTKVADFLADLDAGHVVGVWHELLPYSNFPVFQFRTIVRALVVAMAGPVAVAHVASLTFVHDTVIVNAAGRAADHQTHLQQAVVDSGHIIDYIIDQLSTLGILANRIRTGILDIPYTVAPVYAHVPEEAPAPTD